MNTPSAAVESKAKPRKDAYECVAGTATSCQAAAEPRKHGIERAAVFAAYIALRPKMSRRLCMNAGDALNRAQFTRRQSHRASFRVEDEKTSVAIRRPPFVEGERRQPVSVSLGKGEIKALRALSGLCGEAEGDRWAVRVSCS
ncbi:MAG: hypothetical protein NVS3B16_05060 [Vulcanimicrobiaceae bacterium]